MKNSELFVPLAAWLVFAAVGHAVTIATVPIGNPSNLADTRYDPSGVGSVSYNFRMGKYEVTNAQYAEFLNGVDPTGANSLELYIPEMTSAAVGGIVRDPSAANGSKYNVKPGRHNNPVIYVSWFDSIRFANWLHNGQGSGDTENGAYTIRPGTPGYYTITRNPGARWWLPDEHEWYKAAYHKNDGVTGNYWDYPTSTNAIPNSDQPPGMDAPDPSNTANIFMDDGIANGYDDGYAIIDSTQNFLTDVGAYTFSTSPYGTFDQVGNVVEWIEKLDPVSLYYRDSRGSSWWLFGGAAAAHASFSGFAFPTNKNSFVGFRVATSIPEPSAMCLAMMAMSGIVRRRRRRGEPLLPTARSCELASDVIRTQAKMSLLIARGCVVALAGTIIVTSVGTPARAQWGARILSPNFSSVPGSVARGGAGTQVVGWAVDIFGPTVQDHAVLWSGSPASGYSFIDLHPAGATRSQAFGTSGTQQVGYATFSNSNRAGLWNGTAASWLNLNPAGATRSEAFATTGAQQVGYATFSNANHAGLWSGAAASWIDLHPAGAAESAAKFIAGTQQVGYARYAGNDHAGLWNGTAGSWVDLNPAGATSSQVNGIFGTQEVGQATFGGATHAGLWDGTAGSWIDLNPAGATSSVAYAVSGTTQVGYARFGSTTYPGVWTGTADSWEPLPRPSYPEDQGSGGFSEFLHAEGSSIWTDGNCLYVAGYVRRWFYVASAQDNAAVLWWRPLSSPLPGDFNGDNVVDVKDYLVWRKGLGTTYSQADYSVWRSHFGQTGGSGAVLLSAESPSAAVPEPSSLGLLLPFATAVLLRRRTERAVKASDHIRTHPFGLRWKQTP